MYIIIISLYVSILTFFFNLFFIDFLTMERQNTNEKLYRKSPFSFNNELYHVKM